MVLAGRNVIILGLGSSGFAAARALSNLGARVVVSESSTSPAIEQRAATLRDLGIAVETDGHHLETVAADVAVVSPGISPRAPVMEQLMDRGVSVIGEVELAYRLAECDVLAVTGTNGKTTTTTLLSAMLNEAGIPCVAAGNIGTPLIEVVQEVPEGGVLAVEVSSFQLATSETFHPRVAVILNVAEDHTDWHGDIGAYAAAKARVTRNQDAADVLVYNLEDVRAVDIAASARARKVPFSSLCAPHGGAGVQGSELLWRDQPILSLTDLGLPGEAGIEDAAAAAAAALEYGADIRSVARALRSFKPLRHRLEVVAEAGGVTFVDDSKATNPHATLSAVRGFKDVVLIAGGRSKGIDLSPLAATVPPVVAVIAIGEAAAEIERVFAGLTPVQRAETMEEAVRRAGMQAPVGGSVLLSPGCASLDMYESYAQRGEAFVEAVRALVATDKS